MIIIIVNSLAVLVMMYFAVTKPVDRSVALGKFSSFAFWTGLLLLTLYGAIWLIFGIGEISSGDLSGISHLVPAFLIYVLIYLCWRRPFEGGITLLATAIIFGVRELPAYSTGMVGSPAFIIIGVLPPLLAGFFLILAWTIARRSK